MIRHGLADSLALAQGGQGGLSRRLYGGHANLSLGKRQWRGIWAPPPRWLPTDHHSIKMDDSARIIHACSVKRGAQLRRTISVAIR